MKNSKKLFLTLAYFLIFFTSACSSLGSSENFKRSMQKNLQNQVPQIKQCVTPFLNQLDGEEFTAMISINIHHSGVIDSVAVESSDQLPEQLRSCITEVIIGMDIPSNGQNKQYQIRQEIKVQHKK